MVDEKKQKWIKNESKLKSTKLNHKVFNLLYDSSHNLTSNLNRKWFKVVVFWFISCKTACKALTNKFDSKTTTYMHFIFLYPSKIINDSSSVFLILFLIKEYKYTHNM